MEGVRKPSSTQITFFFISEVIIFFSFNYLLGIIWPDKFSKIILLIIVQTLAILLPPLIFLKLFNFDLKILLRLNKVKISVVINTIFLILFAMMFSSLVNFIYMFLYHKYIGNVELQDVPMMKGNMGFLVNILVIALMPAVFEEILFRGTIQRGYENFGYLKSVFITGILFGAMHFSQYQIVGLSILGCFIGYIVYRTNSLYMGMLAHFINNFIAVVISFIMVKVSSYINIIENSPQDINQTFEKLNFNVIFIALSMIFILSIIITGLIVSLNYITRENHQKQIYKDFNNVDIVQKIE